MRNFLLSLLAGCLCLLPAQTRAATATKAETPAQAAQDEIVRRQEAQLNARNLISQGQKLYSSGRYEEAAAKFEQALRILPRAKQTERDRAQAIRGVTDAYNKLADAALQAGDTAKAQQMANKALDFDSNNSAAKSTVAKIAKAQVKPVAAGTTAASAESHPEQTPEFLAKKDEIKKLFREGQLLLNSGQLDEAERRFQQILLIDPYNQDATVLIERVNKQRLDVAQIGADATRTRRLWEVTDAWIPPLGSEVQVPKPGESGGPIATSGARQAALTQKLNSLIIPAIDFRDAVVTDVLRFLSDESRRLDTVDHSGVNIVLQLGESGAAPAPAPAAGAPGTPAPTPDTGGEGAGGRKVTLSLRNIPLVEALRFVTSIAGLKFRVETSAVLVLPKDYPETDMITRTYPVESGAVREVLAAPTTAAAVRSGTQEFTAIGGGTTGEVKREDLKAFFTDAGVPFPAGSSLVYNERTSTIILRNTPENVEVFERVLAALNVVPKQVEIEAKFVEIAQNDLDELGFQWFVGPYTLEHGTYVANGGSVSGGMGEITAGLRDNSALSGDRVDALLATAASVANPEVASISGILSDPQFHVIIKALAQKKSTDVMYAPKVTTISGNTAQMKVVREFIYPTEYSLPQVAQNATSPSIPQSFKTREIGQLLNVTPTVGADGYTINLTIVPEVSDFEGFLDYSPGASTAIFSTGSSSGSNGETIVVSQQNVVVQPLFNSRNLSTSVVVWDGQTVVLGGLLREDLQKFDDKVPVLGDIPLVGKLFRSKVTTRTKRNLLIFVTARLVRPDGTLIHRPAVASASFQ